MKWEILQTEYKQLSDEITVVWYWYDLKPQNSCYIFGESENMPRCGVYKNGQLVSTVNWNQSTVTLKMIERFLSTNPLYVTMPGWSPVPKTL